MAPNNLKVVATDGEFQTNLQTAADKLVVIDFFATWCNPCRQIAPAFERLATKFPGAVFIKLDVDQCKNTAEQYSVSALPTFIFVKNRARVDMMRGADAAQLESKIEQWAGAEEEGPSLVKGHMDLTSFFSASGCECLNESNEHTLSHALSNKGGFLESDCDEQLLISVAFNQNIKLHSLRMTGPADKAPKTVKIFINQPKTLDFDSAESMTPVQLLELTEKDVQNDSIVPLQFVKFQNVNNITLFIKDNLGGGEVTQIDNLAFIGSPVTSTNMSDFKRVAGKKGESH